MISSRWWILCLICICLPATIFAQTQTISIDRAVELSIQNSLQQELAMQEKLRKQGEAVQSRAFPNPRFSVSHEQLDRGTIDYHETTFLISQPLEILGQSFLRNRRSSIMEEAAEFEYIAYGQLHVKRVRNLYMDYWQVKKMLNVHSNALETIEKSMETARARQEEGVFSGFETQRFAIEFKKYNRVRNEMAVAAVLIKQELISLVFADSVNQQNIHFNDSFSVKPVILDKETLSLYAISNRPDIKALEQHRQAFGLQYSIERRNRFPNLNLDVGYKNQSDGSEGLVVGASLNIPLFNMNRGNIAESRAAINSAETSLQIQKQMIRNRVFSTIETIDLLYQQWELEAENPDMESLLETAQSSYNEGRLSLFELLDATKAWLDDRMNYYQFITDYNQALFELDALTSGMILSTLNSSNP